MIGFAFLIVVIGFMTIQYYDSKNIDYKPKITKALIDSLINQNNRDSIIDPTKSVYLDLIRDYKFPEKYVDRIIVQRTYNPIDILFPKVLSKLQMDALIGFLNDTTRFDWAETTFDKVDYLVIFYNNDKIVAKLDIGIDCMTIDCIPINPRLKYGRLSERSLNELIKIIK